MLKNEYIVNCYGQLEKKFKQWEFPEPTEVMIDTPLLHVNKGSVDGVMNSPFPAYSVQPPGVYIGPFDRGKADLKKKSVVLLL